MYVLGQLLLVSTRWVPHCVLGSWGMRLLTGGDGSMQSWNAGGLASSSPGPPRLGPVLLFSSKGNNKLFLRYA